MCSIGVSVVLGVKQANAKCRRALVVSLSRRYSAPRTTHGCEYPGSLDIYAVLACHEFWGMFSPGRDARMVSVRVGTFC